MILGIEGGGTRTVALLADVDGAPRRRIEAGPANLRLLDDRQLARHLRSIAKRLPKPSAVAIGMAGTRTEADRERMGRAAAKVWPGVPFHATNDLETALIADDDENATVSGHRGRRCLPGAAAVKVLLVSGTGSCCFGRTTQGRTAKVGGWGHVLGDKGSGYEIGLRALKAAVHYYDRDAVWSGLGQRLLRKLQLNEPNDLIEWAQRAGKNDIASLTPEVFDAWHSGDKIAADILAGAADSLANDAVTCARRLVKERSPVHFILTGGVLLTQPRFARKVSRLLRNRWPRATVTPLKREGAWGAVELARKQFQNSGAGGLSSFGPLSSPKDLRAGLSPAPPGKRVLLSLESLHLSPTEQRNPRSGKLDKLSLDAAIRLMLLEDAKIPRALLAKRGEIARVVQWIVRSFRQGGRLLYIGAGTSGRLGVLDASECPPTFRTPPDLVQGIIAGGQRALWESIEGAEDDAMAGGDAIRFRGVSRKDVVVGIAASGRTPFVWGALWEARRRGAKTVLLCFNPHLKVAPRERPDLVIAPEIGPEILTGSTRLKAGTATKLILNMFTTLAMVRMGKVAGNLMIDLNPSNVKLRDRAVRIIRELTGVNEAEAKTALEKSGWVVKDALRRLKRNAG